ncbi:MULTISPECIES: hypothetical protein [Sphingobacterium]|uniref:Antimicrobial peptide, SdpC family n=2 Tax=Sphingobacterium TaxID=28453 RepID=A0ABX7CV13_SPHMU|nr:MULTISPECIES: hypothetical protein [Sphingobacterium]QQT28691.1 hypothetical protein I6I99_15125 [Sphingobacterium multivorum]QQT55240.1 hypothetical protein I6I98_08300 [Sphingobacterium multivorum]RKF38943.1 hypothetical protein BCY89_26725 [Sphingobacterium siyangense]
MKIKQLILITLSVIVGSIIIYSCTKDANEDAKSQYSGEEMFRAIYFLEGNAVNELSSLKPALSQMQKSKSANPDRKRDEFVKEMNNVLISTIKELDKDFFENFKRQVEADDYYAIQLAIGNGARMLRAAGFKSKYAPMFNFLEEVGNKNINLKDEKFKGLDFQKESDVKKFVKILKDDHGIDIDMDQETQLYAVCNFGIACAVALVAVATMAVAAQSVAGLWVYYVYSKVEFWGVVDGNNTDAANEGFIRDVALTF